MRVSIKAGIAVTVFVFALLSISPGDHIKADDIVAKGASHLIESD